MLQDLRATIRERRVLFSMILAVLLVLLLAMIFFGIAYQRTVGNLLAEKVLHQNESMLEINTQSIDEVLSQCKRVTVAIQNDRRFTMEYIATHPTAFISICDTLTDYASLITNVEDIFFANQGYSGVFTIGGVYNPVFFNEQPSSLPAWTATWLNEKNILYTTRPYFTTALERDQVFTTPSDFIEYVIPVQYGKGVVGFRIRTQAFMPPDAEIELILAGQDGTLLYQSDHGRVPSDSQSLLDTALSLGEATGVMTLEDHRYYYLIQTSSAAPLYMLYLLPYDQYMAELLSANRLFVLVCIAFVVLCGGLAVLLVRYAYAPVRRMRQVITGAQVDIPRGLNEAESAHYALTALGDRFDALQTRHRNEQLLRRLFSQDIAQGDFVAECTAAGIRIEDRHVAVWMLSANAGDELLARQILDEAVFLLSRRYTVLWMDYASRLTFSLLLLSDTPIEPTSMQEIAQHLHAKYQDRFALGMSTSIDGYQQAYRAFQQARIAVRACLRCADGPTYCFYDALPEPPEAAPYPKTEIEGLSYAIMHQNAEHVELLVNVLIRTLREQSQGGLSYCLGYDIVNTMLNAARQSDTLSARLASNPRYAYDAIELTNLTDLIDLVQQLTGLILDGINERSNLYAQTLTFIVENLLNQELYADGIAAHFDISVQKLNQLYKEHEGQTVTGYIAARRHEYIKRMLISSEIPIRTLALQMGYSQPSSFIRNFKHEEGMPPGEYRARYGKAEDAAID